MAVKKMSVIGAGDMVKFKNESYAPYGYNTGSIGRVMSRSGTNLVIENKNGNGGTISVMVSYVEKTMITKEELEKNIKELKKEIEDTQDKIDWMEETKSEVYDETEVKVWKTLKTLNSASSDVEKARVIAKLING